MARPGLGLNMKFLRLARMLKSKVLARGVLETLWEPCYEAGDPYLGTSDDIETLCEWMGERGALTRALVDAGIPKAGFIELAVVRDAAEPHYQVHELLQNAPEYVANRRTRQQERTVPKTCVRCEGMFYSADTHQKYCSHACRVGSWRDRQRTVTHRNADIGSDRDDKPRDRDELQQNETHRNARETHRNGLPAPVPVPVQAVRVHVRRPLVDDPVATRATVTATDRHEDRHEGNEQENPPVARPHQRPQKRRAPDPPPDVSPIVLTFPVTGVRGPTWDLREAVIVRWQELYPALDVLAEARHALAYVEAASARRKTFDGMTKFLVAWLNRSTDSSRGRGPTLITGSLKTAGNKAALEEFVRRNARVD